MFHSARANYVNFGSDIGGYRSDDSELGRAKETFIRWAQLGALVPLMENGGSKEHRLTTILFVLFSKNQFFFFAVEN